MRSSVTGGGALSWVAAASERPSFSRTVFPGSLIHCKASCWEQQRRECPLASATKSPTCALWRLRRGNGLLFCRHSAAQGAVGWTSGSSCYRLHLPAIAGYTPCSYSPTHHTHPCTCIHTQHTHTHTLLSERYCLLIPCSPPAILVHGPHGQYPLNERTSELFLDLRQSWNGLHLDNHPCRSTAGHCREQGREGGGVEGDGGENATVLAQLLSS